MVIITRFAVVVLISTLGYFERSLRCWRVVVQRGSGIFIRRFILYGKCRRARLWLEPNTWDEL